MRFLLFYVMLNLLSLVNNLFKKTIESTKLYKARANIKKN